MTGFGSSCGACKFLRRKCSSECIFAPYFCYDEAPSHFAAVHKVFGASNVSKLLLHLPVHNRSDAATTISYEALARVRDPIYGCVAHIFALQQQIACLQEEIDVLGNQIAHNLTVGINANCGSNSEATNNSNSNVNGTQILSQNDAMNSQYYQNQQEILLSQIGNSNGNTNNQLGFDGQMGVQFPSLNGWEEENVPNCHSFSDPLGKLFEGMEQENLGNSPWLDDIPIVENCIGTGSAKVDASLMFVVEEYLKKYGLVTCQDSGGLYA